MTMSDTVKTNRNDTGARWKQADAVFPAPGGSLPEPDENKEEEEEEDNEERGTKNKVSQFMRTLEINWWASQMFQ